MTNNSKWTDAELKACVKAYLEMLELERNNIPYSKTDYRNKLLKNELSGRSSGSIEYRMENISAILNNHGLPFIKGYKPAYNVGKTNSKKIMELLEEFQVQNMLDYLPTTDNEDLNIKVERIIKKIDVKIKPIGNDKPSYEESNSIVYMRDPLVKAWVLKNSEGFCEGCGSFSPFEKENGQPYLEVHHLIPLSGGGPDTIQNVIAVCPNCHRRLHYSKDKETFKKQILNALKR